jgi:hypothetical protein
LYLLSVVGGYFGSWCGTPEILGSYEAASEHGRRTIKAGLKPEQLLELLRGKLGSR